MAERLHIDIDATAAAQNVANLVRQVDQFALALGRVDQSVRRTFTVLEDLSTRYQEQGFLGRADQRTLERGLAQWQRATQVLTARRIGAEGLLQDALARFNVSDIDRARAAATQFGRQQQAMGVLQARVSGIIGGPVPASPLQAAQMAAGVAGTPFAAGRFTPWAPGMTNPNLSGITPTYLGRFSPWAPPLPYIAPTPLQAAYGVQQLQQWSQTQAQAAANQSRLQQIQLSAIAGGLVTGQIGRPPGFVGQATPLQAAHAVFQNRQALQNQLAAFTQNQQTQLTAIAAHLLTQQTPLQVAHATQFGPLSPVQQAHAAMMTQRQAGIQQGLQQAQLLSLFAQMGPPMGPGGAGGGGGGGGIPAGLGWAARFPARTAMGLAGLAIGTGAYQFLGQGMNTMQARALGVLDIGSVLDGQYKQLDTTLRALRTTYHLTTQEAAAGMMTIARATGSTAAVTMALGRNIGFGRAYGVAPGDVAGWQAQMGMLSSTALPDLGFAVGQRHAMQAAGFRTLPLPGWMEATAQIAAAGGLGVPALAQPEYERLTAYMTAGGGRFAMFPGQAFQELQAGLGTPAGPMHQAMRWQVLHDVARTHPTLDFGGMKLNIRGSYRDQQIALENAAYIEPLRNAMAQKVGQLAGGNVNEEAFWAQGMLGAPTVTSAVLRLGQMRAGMNLPAATPLTAADAAAQARLLGHVTDPTALEGMKVRRQIAEQEIAADNELAKALVHAREGATSAVMEFGKALQNGKGFVDATTEALRQLNPQLLQWGSFAATVAGAIASLVPGGQWVGVPLLVGGAGGSAGATWQAVTAGQGTPVPLPTPMTLPTRGQK